MKHQISERGHNYGVKHILVETPQELFPFLTHVLSKNENEIKFLLNFGAIYLNSKRIESDFKKKLQQGDYIRIHTTPRRFPKNHYDWNLRIKYENEYFLVVDKPSGLPCHSSVDNLKENLIEYLQDFKKSKLWITHRLDVPTSGLLVFAKSQEAQTLFNNLLIQNKVQKFYKAKVSHSPYVKLNEPLPIKLIHHMEKSPKAPKVIHKNSIPNLTQECILYLLKESKTNDEAFELEIQLETGRTHQIRSQLSYIGCPIIGDLMYGGKHNLGNKLDLICYPDEISDESIKIDSIELKSFKVEFYDDLSNEKIQIQL